MTLTPLQFARHFEEFTSKIAENPSKDLCLLVAVDFWAGVGDTIREAKYRCYLDEFNALLLTLIDCDSLGDLHLDELYRVRTLIADIQVAVADAKMFDGSLHVIGRHLASRYCWLGEPEQAVGALGGAPVELDSDEDNRPADAFQRVSDFMRRISEEHECAGELKEILTKWRNVQDEIWDDRVMCLLVDNSDGKPRGRMRPLIGAIERREARGGAPDNCDYIAVDAQIRGPDDPFTTVVQEGLIAVRKELYQAGMRRTYRGEPIEARLFLRERITLTGDSIGLATALISYAQLVKPEVLRHEKYISGNVVVTGSIDRQGRILPISAESLAAKVSRVFFSPQKVLVLPVEHVPAASLVIDELQKDFPHRILHLIGARDLTQVVQDRNVIRSERLCMSQFVVRKVTRWSRLTTLQIPILLILTYLLLSLIYPPVSFWFDRAPSDLEPTAGGFIVRNKSGHELWRESYSSPLVWNLDDPYRTRWQFAEIDGDAERELLIVPHAVPDESTSLLNQMICYDHEGSKLFHCTTFVYGQYPGDSDVQSVYWNSPPYVLYRERDTIVVVESYAENFARQHMRFLDPRGELTGWYIHSGFNSKPLQLFGQYCLREYINNRLEGRVGLSVIDPTGVCGVSPPYDSTAVIDLSKAIRAEHKAYVVFPHTDVREAIGSPYTFGVGIEFGGQDEIIVKLASKKVRVTDGIYTVYYHLNADFRLTHVSLADDFTAFRELQYREGKLPAVDWKSYIEDLERRVEYWTDSGFVSEGQLRDAEATTQLE